MNAIYGNFPIDFEQTALDCGDTPSFFPALKEHIYNKIKKYDPVFGGYMLAHLEKTSQEARLFLGEVGIDEKAANVIADAFSLHDAGKILQPLRLWALSEEKPNRTEAEKQQRMEHGVLGIEVLNKAVAALKIVPTEQEQRFIILAEKLMVLHHERLDGSGPQGMKLLDPVLQAITIIDQIDGKGKNKSLTASFEDMNGKHQAEFNQAMVAQYEQSSTRRGVEPTQMAKLEVEGLQI